MTKTLVALTIVALFVGAGLAPIGVGQTPLVDLSLGVTYAEDFDADTGGYKTNEYEDPTRPDPVTSWEWGAPTSGPGAAASGSNVWATNLAGNYGANECGAIMSPVIDLTSASSASVSFAQWFKSQVSSWSGDVYDGVVLFATRDGGETLTRLVPDGGYSDRIYWSPTRACMDGSPYGSEGFGGATGGWITTTTSLDAFVGDSVQFVISFGSSSSSHYAGWYVDDFTVTIDGSSTTESFETDDGGFTLVSTALPPLAPIGWEYGVAEVGPGTDSPLWGINLDGDYGPNECSSLESPPVVIGEDYPNAANAAVRATLMWDQWFRTASGVGAGVVQIGDGSGSYTNLVPFGGYASNNNYLKDAHEACLEYESQGSGAFAGYLNAEGGDMVEFAADVSPWLGEEVTIRFLFATSDFSYSGNTGWYVDDVVVELSLVAEAPVSPDDLVPEIPDLSSADAPGWSSGGDLSTWAYGVASSGPEGETVYATNLEGDHAERECSFIDSPPVPGALLEANPLLEIEAWWEMYLSSFSGPWAAAVVLVSTDGGATWEYLEEVDGYTHPVTNSLMDDCFEGVHGLAYPVPGAFGGSSDGFESATADLAAYADAPTVQVRVLFSGYTLERPGMYVRSVSMGGAPLL